MWPAARSLQHLGDGAMKETTARRKQAAIRDVADPIVGEVQVIPHGLEHALANHLFDGFRHVALVHAARGWSSVKSNRRPMTAAAATNC